MIGKNLTVSGTKVGSLLDTTRALDFAARVSDAMQALTGWLIYILNRANSSQYTRYSLFRGCQKRLKSFVVGKSLGGLWLISILKVIAGEASLLGAVVVRTA